MATIFNYCRAYLRSFLLAIISIDETRAYGLNALTISTS